MLHGPVAPWLGHQGEDARGFLCAKTYMDWYMMRRRRRRTNNNCADPSMPLFGAPHQQQGSSFSDSGSSAQHTTGGAGARAGVGAFAGCRDCAVLAVGDKRVAVGGGLRRYRQDYLSVVASPVCASKQRGEYAKYDALSRLAPRRPTGSDDRSPRESQACRPSAPRRWRPQAACSTSQESWHSVSLGSGDRWAQEARACSQGRSAPAARWDAGRPGGNDLIGQTDREVEQLAGVVRGLGKAFVAVRSAAIAILLLNHACSITPPPERSPASLRLCVRLGGNCRQLQPDGRQHRSGWQPAARRRVAQCAAHCVYWLLPDGHHPVCRHPEVHHRCGHPVA